MCYSDHNEDIWVKGNCDFCLGETLDVGELDQDIDRILGLTEISTENLGRLFD